MTFIVPSAVIQGLDEWVLLGVAFVMCLVSIPTVLRLWSGNKAVVENLDRNLGRYWPLGESSYRAFRRMGSVGGAAVLCAVVALAADGTVAAGLLGPATTMVNRLCRAASTLAMWAALLLLVAMLGVILLNRPKLLVPPAFREEPGMLVELLRGIGGSRKRRRKR
jgi:hypothetical protein